MEVIFTSLLLRKLTNLTFMEEIPLVTSLFQAFLKKRCSWNKEDPGGPPAPQKIIEPVRFI